MTGKAQVDHADLAAVREGLRDALERAARALQADDAAEDLALAHGQLRTALVSQKGALGALLQTANAMGGGGE